MLEKVLEKVLVYVGFFGPFILLFITSALLFLSNKYNLLAFYVGGFFLNSLLNGLLKIVIKDPRPSEDIKLFEAELHNGKRISFDRYGMPSGHAQSMGYSIGFIFGIFKNPIITNIYLILALITMAQRYLFKNHTIAQLLVGFITGIGVGLGLNWIAFALKVGKLREKRDDYGPTYLFGL